MKLGLFLLFIALGLNGVQCWDQEELDVFDLVEEIGLEDNFYNIMGVDQVNCSIMLCVNLVGTMYCTVDIII